MLSLSRTDAIFAVGSEMNVQKISTISHTQRETHTYSLTPCRTDSTNKYIQAGALIIAIFFAIHRHTSLFMPMTLCIFTYTVYTANIYMHACTNI